ncbi:MAG: AAA family ATPase [Alphaproteobacteria bacterium]
MSAVTSINPEVRRLEAPTELRGLQGWLIWRLEDAGTGKPLKVPYWAQGGKRHGKQGGPEDRDRLVTFAAAQQAAAKRGFTGVGLALLPEFGITALDFDYCFLPSGRLPREIEDIVSRTYAEFSPSGQGVRAFVRGSLGNHKSHRDATHDYGFETFASSGFVTFTGAALPSTELMGTEDHIAPVDERVIALCNRRFGASTATPSDGGEDLDAFARTMFERPLGYTLEDAAELLADVDPSEPRETWIQTGMALHHEFGGSPEALGVWDDWSSDGVQYPGTEALRTQWDSFERRDMTRRPVTLATLKKMSNDARAREGKQPRSFDLINRAAEKAREQAQGRPTDPDTFISSPDYTGKYRIYGADEFTRRPPIRWMIKTVLPRDGELIVIYGAPGSGKSLMALDLTMALVRGEPWRGLKVNKARVLYVAAEGAEGVAQRLKAYGQHHDVALGGLPLGIIHDAPNLMVEEDASALVTSIIDAGGADVIVADTWAQVTPGANENSGEDMGLALKHCRAIRQATGAIVILIAHTGKDASRGIRGWSGLNGAANTTLEVIRDEDTGARMLKITKMKDGRDDIAPWGFKLEDVMIGIDGDGEAIISPVVVETDAPVIEPKGAPKPGAARKFGVWERVVLDYIATLGPDVSAMDTETLIKGALGTVDAPTDGSRDLRGKNIRRALTTLVKGKDAPLLITNGMVDFFIA